MILDRSGRPDLYGNPDLSILEHVAFISGKTGFGETRFFNIDSNQSPSYKMLDMTIADSEIRTHDGALRDSFSEQNRSRDDSGTLISET